MGWREWDTPRAVRAGRATIGSVCQAVASGKCWPIGLPLATLALAGAVLSLQPPRYSAESRVITGSQPGGIIGLRASAAAASGSARLGGASGQASLIASRDLARRVIKDLGLANHLEFDPAAAGLGLGSRALVLLGIRHDPARKSPEDRILEAFQERLRVSGPDKRGLVTIAFQSENPALAAKAANRLAELYLDMRANAEQALPRQGAARIASLASPPLHPLPRDEMLLLTGTAMAVIAFGAFMAIVLPRFRFQGYQEELLVQPLALGEFSAVARITVNDRLNTQIAQRSDPPPQMAGQTAGTDPQDVQAVTKAAAHILSLRAQTPRGIRILVTRPRAASAEPSLPLEFARELARRGRSIAINFDATSSLGSGSVDGAAMPGSQAVSRAEPALADLIAGTASFSEAIRRDPASRLHLLPAGQSRELDIHELGNVLDSLAEIYDFIVMTAPPVDQDDMAKILAANSDIAVLVVPASADGGVFAAERQLIENGARELLLISLEADAGQGLGRDAA